MNKIIFAVICGILATISTQLYITSKNAERFYQITTDNQIEIAKVLEQIKIATIQTELNTLRIK